MFYYLFYRIYRFQTGFVEEKPFVAAYTAFMGIGAYLWLNCFSVFIILDKERDLLSILKSNIQHHDLFVPLGSGAVFMVISYFVFFFKKKHKRIINNIENGNARKNRINNILAITYQVASFMFFIFAIGYSIS